MASKYTFEETVTVIKHVRTAMDIESGLTVMRAYDIAEQAMEKLFREQHPSPSSKKSKSEVKLPPLPGLGGPDVTTHKEKTFKFSDGSVIQCCSATGCGWARTTKNHSDGMEGGTLYSLDIPDAVEDEAEVSPDDPRELQADEMRGEPLDEGEVGIVPDLTWEEEIVEDATSEEADDGVMLECE